jgi:hypothetical protein
VKDRKMGKAVKSTSQRSNRIPVSTGAVRQFLLDQMVAVAAGKQDHPTALAVCRYAQQVYNFCKLELRAADLTARHGNVTLESWAFHTDPRQIDASDND